MKTVPEQKHGFKTDTVAERFLETSSAAHDFFLIAKQRLLQINKWNEYAGSLSATFQLCDLNGDEVQRYVEQGDYFKIQIPGPGNDSGDGYDWVSMEKVEEVNKSKKESIVIIVRPSSNPCNSLTDIAHFFDESATSTFIINRNKDKVTAKVHGRSELPNTDADDFGNKIRNTIMATAAISGFSKIQ